MKIGRSIGVCRLFGPPAGCRCGVARTGRVCHDARAVPTYDYQCRSCGSVTEVIHSMLDAGPTVCEQCGGELRRVLFPAGIIFKGSGFYRTDSRNGGATASRGGEEGAASGKASKESPSSGSAAGDAPSPSGSESPKGGDAAG